VNSNEVLESEVNLNISEMEDNQDESVEKSENLIKLKNEIEEVLSFNQTETNFNISNGKYENGSRLFNDTFEEVFSGNEVTQLSESFVEPNATTPSILDPYNSTVTNFTFPSNQSDTNIHEDQTENIEFAWITGKFSPVF
jgi:hypothetical protein